MWGLFLDDANDRFFDRVMIITTRKVGTRMFL